MTTIPDTPSPTSSDSPYAAHAREMLTQLRALASNIEGFAFGRIGSRNNLNFSASVPDRFLLNGAVALEATTELADASRRYTTAQGLRDTVDFSREYLAVADELELVAKALRNTIALRRSRADDAARKVYAIAKGLNHGKGLEQLVPHLERMRRSLARRRSVNAPPEPEVPDGSPAEAKPGQPPAAPAK